MALHSFSRTELLIGKEGLEKLAQKKVAVFGIGGVGTFVVEGLARTGIRSFVLVDDDDICLTNINRQIHALRSTVGRSKVEVMRERILDINPKAEVITYKMLYNSETAEKLLADDYDYVVDAIDMVSSKLDLAERCYKKGIPIISSMGAGNKLDPTRFEVADIYKTSICPLAKVMRKELRKRGVEKLKVVYSKEKPIKPINTTSNCKTDCICTNKERTCTVRRQIPGSVAFVPSVAGLIIASEVMKDLLNS
jgi:tRNA A37 threonylcarbamoyladenosine dehydratase